MWLLQYLCSIAGFYNMACLHHHYTMADVVHHIQIVRDKQVCEVEFSLQVFQPVSYTHLDVYKRQAPPEGLKKVKESYTGKYM